jgi:hypothetical protein
MRLVWFSSSTRNPAVRLCRAWCRLRDLLGGGDRARCQIMANFTELSSVSADGVVPRAAQGCLAVPATGWLPADGPDLLRRGAWLVGARASGRDRSR